MLKENWRLVSRLEQLGDWLIIIAAFFIAYYGRGSLLFWNSLWDIGLPFEGENLAPLAEYTTVLGVALLSYTIVLNMVGAYSSMRLSSSGRLVWLSLLSSGIVFIVLSATLFLLKLDLSRSFISLFCGLVALLLSAERFAILRLLRFWRVRGKNFRTVLICGIGEQALRLTGEILSRPELGLRIRGFADIRSDRTDADRDALYAQFRSDLLGRGFGRMARIFSGTARVQKALCAHSIDEVIFTDVVEVLPLVEELVLICSEQGIRTTLAADLFSIGMVRSGLSYFGGMPLIHFQTPPGDGWELTVKRVVDIGASAFALALLAPLFALIALAIRLDSPGPVLFRQRRVGLNGRTFTLLKFRSMNREASRQLSGLRAQNEMVGPTFKMKFDPRVTRVGRVLRRFSLDELPQLWNVLVGDMSLVGPRPPVPGEVSLYERRDRRRLSMRPGLTCTWQVSGRNEIVDFDRWVKLDLEYIDNWSLGRDLLLLFRTIPAVVLGTGAR